MTSDEPSPLRQLERTHPYDVGILLVHGIGEQRKGDTLVEFGGFFFDCLEKTLAGLAWHVRRKQGRSCRVDLETVQMRHEEQEEPAYAELRLSELDGLRQEGTPHQQESTSRWIVAESWWAKAFPQPTFSEVFHWAINSLPITLVSHFDRRVRRTLFELRNPDNLASPISKFLRLLRNLGSFLAALILVPSFLCLLVLILLFGFLPIPFVDSIARWAQRLLAATVGDSFVLLDKQLARRSIVETVRQDLKWLAQRCERIAVVAHSQGAAIAHEALRNDPLSECELLVTYGSGLQKLSLLEQMSRLGNTAILWLAVLGFFFTSLAVVAATRLQTLLPWIAAGGGVSLVTGSLALRYWLRQGQRFFSFTEQWKADRTLFNTHFRFRNERIEWIDIYARDDPVPNGPLLDEYFPREIYAYATSNLGSTFKDHTAYWQNRDDFVARLVRRTLLLADIDLRALDPSGVDRQNVAVVRRRWRVAWRRLGWWTATCSVILVSWRFWSHPPPLFLPWWSSLSQFAAQTPWIGDWLVHANGSPLNSPLGFLAFLLPWWINTSILSWIWQWWNKSEMEEFYRQHNYAWNSGTFLTYGFLLLTVLTAALTYALGPVSLRVVTAVFIVSAGTWLSDKFGWVSFLNGIKARAAIGSLEEIKTLWRRLDSRSLEKAANRGHRWSLYRTGLRRIKSKSRDDQALGVRALRKAIRMKEVNAAWPLGDYFQSRYQAENKKRLLKAAREIFTAGKRLGDPMCVRELGYLMRDQYHDPAAAMREFEEAAFQFGDPLSAHSLGLLCRRQHKFVCAARAFKRGVQLNDPLSANWLADLYLQWSNNRQDRGQLRSASVLLRAAVRLYDMAVDLGESSAAFDLGTLWLKRDNTLQAAQAFQKGVRLGSSNSALALGRIWLERTQRIEAELALRRAMELADRTNAAARRERPDHMDPVTVDTAWELAQLYEALGRFRDADAMLRLAAGRPGQKTGHALAALRLGRKALKEDNENEAEIFFRRGLEIGSVECAIQLAALAVDRGKSEEARKLLQSAAIAEVRDWRNAEEKGTASLALGRLLERFWDFEKAKGAYFAAIRRGSLEAELRLVNVLVRRLDYKTALVLAKKYQHLKSSEALYRLARLLKEGGHVQEAIQALEGVYRNLDTEMQIKFGVLLEELGESLRARHWYEKAMEAGSAEGASRLGELLKQLGDIGGAQRAFQRARILGYASITGGGASTSASARGASI